MKCYFKKVINKARQNADKIFAFSFRFFSGIFLMLSGAYFALMMEFGVNTTTLIGFIGSMILAVINSSTSLEKYKKHFYESFNEERKREEQSMTIIELKKLCRQWIVTDDGYEIIGEKNFVISAEYFAKIFKTLFPEEQDPDTFLDVYEPECDGEKIYQQALLDNQIVTEFDTIYKDDEEPSEIVKESVEG